MSPSDLSKELLQAIGNDLEPVQPLPPVWRRMLNAFAVAVVIFVISVSVYGVRSDMGSLPYWLSWGCSAGQLAAAAFLIALAMREAIPGRGLPFHTALTAILSASVFQLAVGFMTWRFSPIAASQDNAVEVGMGCMSHEMLLALPTFIVTLWLVFRAFPLRAWMAGLLGGVGSAIASDAITHLQCPISDMRHVLIWHSGAVVLFAAFGAGIGYLWGRFKS